MVIRNLIASVIVLASSAAHGATIAEIPFVQPGSPTFGLFVSTAVEGATGPGVEFVNFGTFASTHLPGDVIADTVFIMGGLELGTTEYKITFSGNNSSGTDWTSVRFVLGFGTGASFIQSGSDLLSFTTVPHEESDFSSVAVLDDVIDFTDGVVTGSGEVWARDIFLQVPDGLGTNEFTLRMITNFENSIPAPATASALFICGAVLIMRK